VLNKKVGIVPGEIVGASLISSPPQLAALLCPAMTMLLRYQGAKPPAQANLVRFMVQYFTKRCVLEMFENLYIYC
jgi:hypothetical protein